MSKWRQQSEELITDLVSPSHPPVHLRRGKLILQHPALTQHLSSSRLKVLHNSCPIMSHVGSLNPISRKSIVLLKAKAAVPTHVKFGTLKSDLPGAASKSQAPAPPCGSNLCSGCVPPPEGTSTPRWVPQQAPTSSSTGSQQHFQEKRRYLPVTDKLGTTNGVWGHQQTSLPPGMRR